MGLPFSRKHFGLRTDDLMANWSAVRAGLGIGFVSNYLIREDPQAQTVLPQLRIRAVFDFLARELPPLL